MKKLTGTIPHDYDVKLLTTQYRSIPVVGNVFSKLTYGGILAHHRNAELKKHSIFLMCLMSRL